MKIQDRISKEVITAATSLLAPYVPEITATSLISAIKGHQAAQTAAPVFEKPLTRQEAAELLKVSLMTISRYLRSGKLKRIQLSGRTVRIDAASFRKLIGSDTGTEAEAIEAK